MPPRNSRPVPPRSDSLRSDSLTRQSKVPAVDDEVHDARRVQTHGQEEDLRDALGRMIGRVEEFSYLLAQAFKSQTELETSLKLARSNLQLALANNEMLEDALKRDGNGRGKDVGWRRWSEREGERRGRIVEEQKAERERIHRMSLDSVASDSASTTPDPKHSSSYPNAKVDENGSASTPGSPLVPPNTASPNPAQDGRFFKFRFGSSSPAPSRPQSPPATKKIDAERDSAHLTSASLPSLVAGPSKREEELSEQLEAERAKHRKARDEKKALEAEIENLSQALFEEANRMVAQERIKCAETEAELRQAREEKDALKGALRIVEMENGRLRSTSDSGHEPEEVNPIHEKARRRTSSTSAIYDPPSPIARTDPQRSNTPSPKSDPSPMSSPVLPPMSLSPENEAEPSPVSQPPSDPQPSSETNPTHTPASENDAAYRTPRRLPSDLLGEEQAVWADA